MLSVTRLFSRPFDGVFFLLLAGIACAQNPSKQPDVKERDLTRGSVDTKTQPTSIPRGYALVIGVAKYQKLDPSENLRYPESDANEIYRVLISQEGGAFPAENVHRLIGPDATLGRIRHEIEEWLPSVAKEPDRVVVYFAGHGVVSGGRGFLAPYDVNPSALEQTAYPMDQLGRVMADKIKARWKVLFADACHSAKITPGSTDAAIDAQLSGMPKTLLTLTATRQQEKSYEDPKLGSGFGLFTYYLVQGLKGNADRSPCDGLITADELIDYVRDNVQSYARDHHVEQTPQEYGDFDPKIILGVSPSCLGGNAPPTLTSGGIVIEVNMDDVQIYVDDNPAGSAAKGKPLKLPGLSTGTHIVKGVRKGYEPDTKEVMVVPGQQRSVTLRIQYRLEYNQKARDLVEDGERHLYKHGSLASTLNPIATYKSGRQSHEDVQKAKDLFTKALKEEPKYGKAEYDLAMACQLLSDTPGMMTGFRKAIEIDPTDVESRVEYAGALIEDGDPDAAIRHLTEAIRLDPDNDVAHSHMARAFLDKEVFDQAIAEAGKAIALNAKNDQAYLWKADALRRQAAAEKDKSRKLILYASSVENYQTYLRITNFATPAYEQFAYYFVGFGLGSRRHADRQVSYAYQRSLAFMGLCESEDKLGHPLRASEYCATAIKYDPKEPMAYFLQGNAYRDLFNSSVDARACNGHPGIDRCREYLTIARNDYAKMLDINPDMDLARNARGYVEQIEATLRMLSK